MLTVIQTDKNYPEFVVKIASDSFQEAASKEALNMGIELANEALGKCGIKDIHAPYPVDAETYGPIDNADKLAKAAKGEIKVAYVNELVFLKSFS